MHQISKNKTGILLFLSTLIILATVLWPSISRVQYDSHKLYKNPTEENKREFDASIECVKVLISGIWVLATVSGSILLFYNVQSAQKRLTIKQFSKAVEQLGSEKIEVRIGGIYTLEQIAQFSDTDHWTVIEVLTAFIREKSPLISEEEYLDPNDEFTWPQGKRSLPEQNWIDVQAALKVIGRRDVAKDPPDKKINFSGIDLGWADLSGANLRYADLSNSDLSMSNLSYADLSYANLSYANLCNANLCNANLTYVKLGDANLKSANFSYANLTYAKLGDANFYRANLSDVNLYRANLSKANLRCAEIRGANLHGADLRTHFQINC